MAASTGAPVAAGERMQALDLLRGFALCGILLMNIKFMGGVPGRPLFPAIPTDPDWIVWSVQALAFEGTMRGLFTLLFGAGMLLMMRRPGIEAADIYFRRCLMLLGFGMMNVLVFLWPADALFIYGVSGAAIFVFRNLSWRRLLAIAAVILLVLTLKTGLEDRAKGLELRQGRVAAEAQAAGQALTPAQAEAAQAWTARMQGRTALSPRAEKEIAQRHEGWLGVLKWSWATWTGLFLQQLLAELVLESIAFMMVGMALLKLGVLTGERSWRVYAAMAAGGYAVGLSLNGWQVWTAWATDFAPDVWSIQVTYQIDRLAMTIGHVGLVLLLWKANVWGAVGRALAAMGRLGLTNYLGQSALTSIYFYGFGMVGRHGWAELWCVAAVVWVIQAILSGLYLRVFSIGPAEWLLRGVAYGRFQSPLAKDRLVVQPAT